MWRLGWLEGTDLVAPIACCARVLLQQHDDFFIAHLDGGAVLVAAFGRCLELGREANVGDFECFRFCFSHELCNPVAIPSGNT